MSNQITLPNLGENIESGDVLSILVSEGDTVKENQDLLEVETDKATMPVPSPSAGKIIKILISEGDTVKVGAPLMEIEAGGASGNGEAAKEEKPAAKKSEPKEEKKAAPAKPEKKKEAAPEPEVDEEEADEPEPEPKKAPAKKVAAAAPKIKVAEPEEDEAGDGQAIAAAGPAVRRLARQLGVDLRLVRPSGDGGRITADDVQSFVRETNEQVAAGTPRGVTPPGDPTTDDHGSVRIEKMSRMRQAIARNMVLSYTTIPQLTNFDDADVTELEDMREQSKGDYASRGIKLTAMPFIIKAVASSLRKHPIVNASVDMENHQIIYKEYVNVGIAVDTDRGLVVPVLRNADRKSIAQIAAELDRIAQMARDGELSLDDMKGGTFTISNLGAIGGTYSTPIINPPEVAILLVGRSRTVAQFVGGPKDSKTLEPRLLMPLSITYDHRVVDGAAAGRFLNEVKSYLTAPGRLLLAP